MDYIVCRYKYTPFPLPTLTLMITVNYNAHTRILWVHILICSWYAGDTALPGVGVGVHIHTRAYATAVSATCSQATVQCFSLSPTGRSVLAFEGLPVVGWGVLGVFWIP